MGKHIHKKFSDDFIRSIFQKYESKLLSVDQILSILKIKRRRFFVLIKQFRTEPENFSVEYKRKSPSRIPVELEKIIIEELEKEKALIEDKSMPIYGYNYSYIKDQIIKDHKKVVSVPTIIDRAKANDFYIQKKPHKKHDREVLTK